MDSLFLAQLANSLTFRFSNIQGMCFNIVDCISLLESNSPFTLALYDTHWKNATDCNLFVRSYLPLIFKDSVDLEVYMGTSIQE